MTLLEQSLDQLALECHHSGKGALYERLKFLLTASEAEASYADVGEAMGMTEAAVKKAAQRLRRRYREVLRRRIAATVEDPGQVEDELRSLFAALSS